MLMSYRVQTSDPTTMQSAQGFPHPEPFPQAFEQGAGDNSGFIHQVFPRCPRVTSSEPTLVPSQIHMLEPCLPTGPIGQSGDPTALVTRVLDIGRSMLRGSPVVPNTNFSPGSTRLIKTKATART